MFQFLTTTSVHHKYQLRAAGVDDEDEHGSVEEQHDQDWKQQPKKL